MGQHAERVTIRSWAQGAWYQMSKLVSYHLRRISPWQGRMLMMFRKRVGSLPNYSSPRTLNEKVGWLRMHYRDAAYPLLADKVTVRDFVAERVGEDVLIPLYGVYSSANDIPFDSLPEQFVLKCNHESNFVIICEEKAKIDRHVVRKQLATRLRLNFFYRNREWQYRDIPPCILSEALLRTAAGEKPIEYKIYCFHGLPRFIIAYTGRHPITSKGHFYPDWTPAPFTISKANIDPQPPRPAALGRMLEIATILTHEMPFCRVDLYSIDDRVYFNELTFTPFAGMMRFYPRSYDRFWGEQLILPVIAESKSYYDAPQHVGSRRA